MGGPGARELTEFFDSVDRGLADHAAASNVLASDQHVLTCATTSRRSGPRS
jgi:hypothetical protein